MPKHSYGSSKAKYKMPADARKAAKMRSRVKPAGALRAKKARAKS